MELKKKRAFAAMTTFKRNPFISMEKHDMHTLEVVWCSLWGGGQAAESEAVRLCCPWLSLRGAPWLWGACRVLGQAEDPGPGAPSSPSSASVPREAQG